MSLGVYGQALRGSQTYELSGTVPPHRAIILVVLWGTECHFDPLVSRIRCIGTPCLRRDDVYLIWLLGVPP